MDDDHSTHCDSAKIDTAPRGGGCAGRMNAKAALQDRITRLRREANMLQELHDLLPGKLTPEADEALWMLTVSRRI